MPSVSLSWKNGGNLEGRWYIGYMRSDRRQKPAQASISVGKRYFDRGETGIISTSSYLTYECVARAQWRSGFVL